MQQKSQKICHLTQLDGEKKENNRVNVLVLPKSPAFYFQPDSLSHFDNPIMSKRTTSREDAFQTA